MAWYSKNVCINQNMTCYLVLKFIHSSNATKKFYALKQPSLSDSPKLRDRLGCYYYFPTLYNVLYSILQADPHIKIAENLLIRINPLNTDQDK